MWLNKEQLTRPSVHLVLWVCVYLKYWVKMLTLVLIGGRTMGNFFPPLKNSSIFTMSMYYFYKEKINVYVLKLSTQNKITFSKWANTVYLHLPFHFSPILNTPYLPSVLAHSISTFWAASCVLISLCLYNPQRILPLIENRVN